MNSNSTFFQRIRVGVVDDHPIIRQGLSQAVAREPDMEMCCEAENVGAALRQFETSKPDVFIVDISLDGEDGIELIDYIKSRMPAAKILVYSAHDEETFAGRVLRAGALGFISKRESIDKVVAAIRTVVQGDVFLSPQMTSNLLQRAVVGQTLDSDPITSLSDRELQVFKLIGEGLSTVQIAKQLMVSSKTIESHRQAIKKKLNLVNGAQLSRKAFQWIMEKR